MIVTCALVAGSATQCDLSKPSSAYYIDAPKVIKDAEGCALARRSAPMESGRRAIRSEFGPTTNELLRGK